MTFGSFIRTHRKRIDAAIILRSPNNPRLNDVERRLWVLNDEGLYRWAQFEGAIKKDGTLTTRKRKRA